MARTGPRAGPRTVSAVLAGLLLLLHSTSCTTEWGTDNDLDEDEDEPVARVSVEAVLDGLVSLPCDMEPDSPSDRAIMVLWFRDATGKPIYTFDVRGRSYTEAQVWSDPAGLGPRAQFQTTPPGSKSRIAQLALDRVQLTDEGLYRCRVDFKSSRSKNYQVNLTVTVPPTTPILFDKSGRQLDGIVGPLEEGSDLILNCEVRGGKPPPTVQWYVNDLRVDAFVERPQENVITSRLVEHHVLRHHLNNTYRCQASNTNLQRPAQRTVRLELILEPQTVRVSSRAQLVADQDAALTCESKGSRPQAVLTWWRSKGSEPIKTLFRRGRVENISTEAMSRSKLTFAPQPSDDGAVITCLAENPELVQVDKKRADNITLNVVYPPIVTSRLGSSLNPDDIKQGDDVYFECNILANPKSRGISWYHEGKPVVQNVTAGVLLSAQSLVMQRVTRANAGRYTCKAVNDQGETTSQPVNLRVKYAPVCRASAPAVVGASLSESVQVHCAVDADPRDVSFTWRLTNSEKSFEVPSERVGPHNATTSMLRYAPGSDRDYGTLTCWGRNTVGSQAEPCVFHVIPAVKPGPLQNCTLRSAASNGSSLQLLAPGPIGTSASPQGSPGPPGVLDVECIPGPDGGLRQTFHMEAYESRSMRLRFNASGPEPAFRLEPGQLLPARTPIMHLVLYATNAKGRGPHTLLEGLVVRTRDRHAAEYLGEEGMSQPVMYTLVVLAALLLLAGLVVLCVAYRRRQDSATQGAGVAKGSRHGNQLDIKHDQCYVVSYTLKCPSDCSSERKPDILETPRGNETKLDADGFASSVAQRPDSLFGGPVAGPVFPYPAPTRELPKEPRDHGGHSGRPVDAVSPGVGSLDRAPGLGLLAACAPPEPHGPAPPCPAPQPIYATLNHKAVHHANGNLRSAGTARELPHPPYREASIADSIPGPESCV